MADWTELPDPPLSLSLFSFSVSCSLVPVPLCLPQEDEQQVLWEHYVPTLFFSPPPTSSSSLPPFPHRPILLHHSSEAHLFSHQPLVGAPIPTAPHSRKENLLLFPFCSALLKSKRPNRRSIHVWMRWCWQSRLRPVGRQMHVWVNAHKHWLQDFTRTSSELTQRELCRYWENRNV